MQLRSKILLLTILFSTSVFARNSTLPILKTKSDVRDIRFISASGNFTYYQRRSGSLLLSTNYKVHELLKGEVGTQFTIHASATSKKLIITMDENFHTYLGIRHSKKIYVTDVGSEKVEEVGMGLDPKLHLKDQWMSWFNPYTRKLTFTNIKSPTLNFEIKIQNVLNAYFFPNSVMLDEKSILYTDINNKGVPAILKYTRRDKKIDVIFKSASVSQRIELCKNDSHLFVAEFGYNNSPRGSIIAKVALKNFNIDRAEIVYQSRQNDFGNIVCEFKQDHLFFIKNISKIGGRIESEVNAFNHIKKSSRVISDLKYVSQLIFMDGRLLVPFRGDYYVLEGETDLTKVGQLKTESDKKAEEAQAPKAGEKKEEEE